MQLQPSFFSNSLIASLQLWCPYSLNDEGALVPVISKAVPGATSGSADPMQPIDDGRYFGPSYIKDYTRGHIRLGSNGGLPNEIRSSIQPTATAAVAIKIAACLRGFKYRCVGSRERQTFLYALLSRDVLASHLQLANSLYHWPHPIPN